MHVTTYTLLLHEKIASFIGVGRRARRVTSPPLDFHTWHRYCAFQ